MSFSVSLSFNVRPLFKEMYFSRWFMMILESSVHKSRDSIASNYTLKIEFPARGRLDRTWTRSRMSKAICTHSLNGTDYPATQYRSRFSHYSSVIITNPYIDSFSLQHNTSTSFWFMSTLIFPLLEDNFHLKGDDSHHGSNILMNTVYMTGICAPSDKENFIFWTDSSS